MTSIAEAVVFQTKNITKKSDGLMALSKVEPGGKFVASLSRFSKPQTRGKKGQN